MRLALVESLLLAGLLMLSAYVLWAFLSIEGTGQPEWAGAFSERLPDYASWELALTIILPLVIYWVLQFLGRSSLAFWFAGLLVILPQAPAIGSHSQLHWFPLFGVEASLESTHSQPWQAALFLGSLVGLIALSRIMGLRRLDRQLKTQGIDEEDRYHVVLAESCMLLPLLLTGLLLAFVMVAVANVLGEMDTVLERSPWGILTVGGSATLLLVLSLFFWFRYSDDSQLSEREDSEKRTSWIRKRLGFGRQQEKGG